MRYVTPQLDPPGVEFAQEQRPQPVHGLQPDAGFDYAIAGEAGEGRRNGKSKGCDM